MILLLEKIKSYNICFSFSSGLQQNVDFGLVSVQYWFLICGALFQVKTVPRNYKSAHINFETDKN